MAKKVWIGTDGDYSTNANWSPTNVPVANDEVYLPAGGGDITAGLNQSAVALDGFIVDEGYTGAIGTSAGYLQIGLGSGKPFRYAGTGTAYIDIGSSAVSPNVIATNTAATGYHGLYLKGSAIATLNVVGGDVGVADIYGETSTVTTVRSVGRSAKVTLGYGASVTTMYQTDGDTVVRCALTTATVYGGTLETQGTGAVTTMNVNGGSVAPESTGTIGTLNANGGETDFTGSGASRTVTTFNHNAGATVTYDPNVLTITTRNAPSGPVRIDMQLAA